MVGSVLSPVLDDEGMTRSRPRAGGPKRRRTFTAAEKLAHLVAYDQACQTGQGGAYLRREGMYSSQITEWRKLRDGGLLEGRAPGEKIGRLSPEQAEIADSTAGEGATSSGDHRGRPGHHGKLTRSWRRSPRARTTT